MRACTCRNCSEPAVATVRFELPNLLAGSRRDYCATHIRQVCLAKGTVVAARLGRGRPTQPAPGADTRAGQTPRTHKKGG
jgi:hypothetical protein